jgi:hypothetical protein
MIWALPTNALLRSRTVIAGASNQDLLHPKRHDNLRESSVV